MPSKFFILILIVIELILTFQVGMRIGLLAMLGIIIVTAMIGARLARAQGAYNMQRAQAAMNEGRMPHEEVLDGMLIIIAGVLLIIPGLLTDALGGALMIPALRSGLRKQLGASIKAKAGFPDKPAGEHHTNKPDDDTIIEAEIIED